MHDTLDRTQFQTAFYAAGLFLISVWILWVGQSVLIPVAFAMIAAFVLWRAVTAIGKLPILGWTPYWLRHLTVLIVFMIALFLLILQIRTNIERLLQELPQYQRNFDAVLVGLAHRADLDEVPNWETSINFVTDQFRPGPFVRRVLAAFSDIGGQVALVVVYTVLLLMERARFVSKLFLSFQDRRNAERTLVLLQDISDRIGGYLAVKTTANIMLGIISYIALRLLEIDLAAFWATAIGVLNYVPYVGSLVAVALPVAMAVAQTGSLLLPAAIAITLVIIQFVFAYLLEPRLIGRRVNLSPFVVLLSLAFWYALWGFAGAVLAIPLTAMFANVLAAIPRTRPVAIMLSNDGRV